MTHKDILNETGTISHEKALEKVHQEYDKYMRTHLAQAEKDYLKIMGEDIKNYFVKSRTRSKLNENRSKLFYYRV